MSRFSNLLRGLAAISEANQAERNAKRGYSLENPNTPLNAAFLDLFGGNRTKTGLSVNAKNSMALSAVYGCVRVIAEGIASIPFQTFRRLEDGGREAARDHYSYKLIHDQPNPYMTSFNWRELMLVQILQWGNHYSYLDCTPSGYVRAIWPLSTDTEPMVDAKRGLYYEANIGGKREQIPAGMVLHVPGLGFDGLKGKSVISFASEAIGLGLAIEQYGSSFYGSGAVPAGVLEHPGKLDDGAVARMKESWAQMYGGLDNAGSIAVLREGMKFSPMTIKPVDAQAIEAKRFQVSDIARFYRVPLMLLQHDTNTQTFASSEQFMLSFKQHTLQPWAVRIEQAVNRCLFSTNEQKNYFTEFNLDGLLRGDFKSRQEGLAVMRQNGAICPDEWRAMENMNPRDDGLGKVYLDPLNMAPGGGKGAQDGQGGNV